MLAHIFIGGRTKGSKGNKPGILEEFLIAKEKGHPIFLLGGFGGETEVIVNHITGVCQGDADLDGLALENLQNGITDTDKQNILLHSSNITEIIPIILQALNELANE